MRDGTNIVTVLLLLILSEPMNAQVTQPTRPATYDSCILENAAAIQKAGNDNALDVIMLSCIKEHEQDVGSDDIAKIKVQSLSYGGLGVTGVGLIAQIYNGSEYDLTAVTFVLNDKKTKEQRTYGYNQFIHYYRGPGIVT